MKRYMKVSVDSAGREYQSGHAQLVRGGRRKLEQQGAEGSGH